MTRMSSRFTASRGAAIAMVVVLMVLISFPVVWGLWNAWRLDQIGVRTEAPVTAATAAPKAHPSRFFVRYHLPDGADPRHAQYIAEVDKATYLQADQTDTIEATYLPGKPGVNRVVGQVSNRLMMWMAGAADLSLLAMLALAMKFRDRKEKPLVLLATDDVVRCKPGFAVEQDGDNYVVRGDILTIEAGMFTVDVGDDRVVRVVLGEYRNPVGYQQPAEVRGRRFNP
jgi:hypothetical protein